MQKEITTRQYCNEYYIPQAKCLGKKNSTLTHAMYIWSTIELFVFLNLLVPLLESFVSLLDGVNSPVQFTFILF